MYTPLLSGDTSKRPLATAVLMTCFPRMSNTLAWIAPDPVEVMFIKPRFAGLGYNLKLVIVETVFEDKVSLNVCAIVKLSINTPSFVLESDCLSAKDSTAIGPEVGISPEIETSVSAVASIHKSVVLFTWSYLTVTL